MFKKQIISLLYKELKNNLTKKQIENLIEIPPSENLGDYAFPCFSLAKKLKKSPNLISQNITENLNKELENNKKSDIEKIQQKGSYVNFFINKQKLAKQIISIDEKLGYSKTSKEKIIVEYLSPNTNKPLHLGHLRNLAIGESISRILESQGNKVIRANLYNDRGIHIIKSMLAYKKFGNSKKPGQKPDKFVGDFYVLFNKKTKDNPELEKQASEMLKKWEQGDKSTLELWKKMNSWAYQGIEKTYKKFGIKFDKHYYESKMYKKGKQIVKQGLKKGIFKNKEDGAVVINLGDNLGEKILLRKDKTSVYITQDLYLAKQKYKDYKFDKSIYVVANEQDYHFKVLFKIIDKLNLEFSSNLFHLSYGMVFLPEGKMKSRQGTVVDADSLMKKTEDLAEQEIKKRYNPQEKELQNRRLKIALSAIKYELLKIDPIKNITFNPKKAIKFEGDTGPYLEYSHARANSILKKAKTSESKQANSKNIKIPQLKKQEIKLIKKISEFPQIIKRAYENLSPNIIANYSFELAQIFNEFYHTCPVISSKEKDFRLKLVDSFKKVMKNSLYLLGIESIKEM